MWVYAYVVHVLFFFLLILVKIKLKPVYQILFFCSRLDNDSFPEQEQLKKMN